LNHLVQFKMTASIKYYRETKVESDCTQCVRGFIEAPDAYVNYKPRGGVYEKCVTCKGTGKQTSVEREEITRDGIPYMTFYPTTQ
jgi:hypothetical protein